MSTRNIAIYRDPAVILIDQLKSIYIDGELEVVDTSIGTPRSRARNIAVGLNLTGVGVDDPDVNLYENYSLQSERNLTQYCNPEVDALIDKQSQETDIAKRKQIVWEIERLLAEDVARPIISYDRAATCWQPYSRVSCCTTTASTTTGASRTSGWISKRRRARRPEWRTSSRRAARWEPICSAALLLMLLTLFGMSVLIFVVLRLVPGNIADILFDSRRAS